MQLITYLTFNGQCEAAFRYYEKCLAGKITMMMEYEGSPMADRVPPEWRKKILHTTLAVGDCLLQGADVRPESYEKPQGFCVALNLDDLSQADHIFAMLAENGSVQMPLQETFWARRFGVLVDQFGTPWVVNCGERP
jgi:PhnB protein